MAGSNPRPGEFVEETGRTVDDAVQRALRRLGLSRRDVDVEVLDEGRSGILGVGQEPAHVRVTARGADGPAADDGDAPLPRIDDYEDPAEVERDEDEPQPDYRGRASRPSRGAQRGGGRPVMGREPQPQPAESRREPRHDARSGGRSSQRGRGREPRSIEPREPLPPFELSADPEFEPDEDPKTFAVEVVRDLTRLMGFDVDIQTREPETPMDGLDHAVSVIEILAKEGDDLGLLIGRHGSHITALQYVVNVILSRALDGDHPITIDVDGYRRRREEALNDIADRAAEEVREYGEPVTLASMPPAERRIIHLALMNEPDLRTESEGDGPNRRVRVLLRDD